MAIMFGNGRVKSYKEVNGDKAYIMKTEQFVATKAISSGLTGDTAGATASEAGWKAKYEGPDGKLYTKVNPKFYDEFGNKAEKFDKDSKYFCTFDIEVEGSVIEISASSFPGTYYVTGDTYARSETSGADEFFQFIIPKAKVQSENTLTMEAEGDPSVFNMNLRVMRPADGIMMKLVKYKATEEGEEVEATVNATLVHNHALEPVTETTKTTET
jgi:hypothetical protein